MNKRFSIQRIPVEKYKGEIISLWERNLPNTPAGRFDWMINNPDGMPIFYLAIHKKSEKIAGSISIMPRKVILRNEICLAGIVGDFMVEKEFRAFGPAFDLMETVKNEWASLGFKFIYTVANQESEKICLKSNFKNIGAIKNYNRVIHVENILSRRINPKIAKVLALPIDIMIRMIFKRGLVNKNRAFEEIESISQDYGEFWEKYKNISDIVGDRSSMYLTWKYFQNPIQKFKIFNYLERDKCLIGYIIYAEERNKYFIFDMIALEEEIYRKMMGGFLKKAWKSQKEAVSIRLSEKGPLKEIIKSFGFFAQEGEDFPLLVAGDVDKSIENWIFFNGDRNI